MARQVSLDGMRAMFAQETGEVPLMCLTLEHPSWDEGPIRVVYNTEAVVRAAGVFYPAPFDISLPNEQSEQVPQVTLTMLNMESSIVQEIKSITGRIKVTLEIVLASQPDVLEAGPFELYSMACTYDSEQIQATLGYEEDILNTLFPAEKYTPANSPGMFQ